MIDSGARQDHTPIVAEITVENWMDYQAVIPEFVVSNIESRATSLLHLLILCRIRSPEINSSSSRLKTASLC